MSKLTKAVALVVLALWGLAIWHCDLERLPGFEFLACCQHPDTAPHQDNDCDNDACSVVESGLYLMGQSAACVPVPSLALSFEFTLLEAAHQTVAPHFELPGSAPPELPLIWQFHYRTALPPRAPTLAA